MMIIPSEPMVRHEAGEALGAIGDVRAIPILEQYQYDSVPEVAETCQLALQRIRYYAEGGERQGSPAVQTIYDSVGSVHSIIHYYEHDVLSWYFRPSTCLFHR